MIHLYKNRSRKVKTSLRQKRQNGKITVAATASKDIVAAKMHATLSREVELLESGRFHTPVLQPGINSPNVYKTYQTLLLLENT